MPISCSCGGKLYQDGSLSAVSAGVAVVPASELSDALKQIRELQRMAAATI
jgi:transposase